MRTRLPRQQTAVTLALLLALVSGYFWLTGQEARASSEHGDHGGSAAPAAIEPLATNCDDSDLPDHTGFQIAPACVSTSFGEVSAQDNNPTLLIVDAPRNVRPGQDITLRVSIRNIIRDRFLAAGAGGYYIESATLRDGITRGHAHGACQSVGDAAPAPVRNASFKAIEDGGGGRGADTVTLTLPGVAQAGEVRCAVWAGDGSHRIPMMQFANQIPAFDSVRVDVRGGRGEGRVRGESD